MTWFSPISIPMPKRVERFCGKPTLQGSRELNKRIFALRDRGLRQWEIAREVGVSRATVGKHLAGKRKL